MPGKEDFELPSMGVIAVCTPDNRFGSRESLKKFALRGTPIQKIETAIVNLLNIDKFLHLFMSTNAVFELIEIYIPGPKQGDGICSNGDDSFEFNLGFCPCSKQSTKREIRRLEREFHNNCHQFIYCTI
ncbi:hypothetical protein [Haladaptatus halobius]|uniref:hypothetical protein n=1 Tax=Haladaptatus halobius TaxID=2884875 RepID=UPI001D09DB6B|nr:hypothetical protein [Haladaptatus halobius]